MGPAHTAAGLWGGVSRNGNGDEADNANEHCRPLQLRTTPHPTANVTREVLAIEQKQVVGPTQ
jgi:hypothetical protein